jgi:hypothetical protein
MCYGVTFTGKLHPPTTVLYKVTSCSSPHLHGRINNHHHPHQKRKTSQIHKTPKLIKIKGLKLIGRRNRLTSKEESFKQEVCPHFGRSNRCTRFASQDAYMSDTVVWVIFLWLIRLYILCNCKMYIQECVSYLIVQLYLNCFIFLFMV